MEVGIVDEGGRKVEGEEEGRGGPEGQGGEVRERRGEKGWRAEKKVEGVEEGRGEEGEERLTRSKKRISSREESQG